MGHTPSCSGTSIVRTVPDSWTTEARTTQFFPNSLPRTTRAPQTSFDFPQWWQGIIDWLLILLSSSISVKLPSLWFPPSSSFISNFTQNHFVLRSESYLYYTQVPKEHDVIFKHWKDINTIRGSKSKTVSLFNSETAETTFKKWNSLAGGFHPFCGSVGYINRAQTGEGKKKKKHQQKSGVNYTPQIICWQNNPHY